MAARVTITFEEMMLLKAEARGFSFLPRQPSGSLLSGRHASRLRGRGLSFEELRHYQQGDDVRAIDWKATARLRSPHVRVFSEERERPVLFLVDQRSPMFFGSRHCMKSVAAAELAALGGWKALAGGDRVGGLVFNEQKISEIRPHRSRLRLQQLFQRIVELNQRLAALPLPSGEVTLNLVLERARSLARHDFLIVLISDLDGADESTKDFATNLAAHNDVLVVAVYDPLGAGLRGEPDMIASDQGRTWKIESSERFAREFQAAFQRRLDQWRKIFQTIQVPVMPISTAQSIPEQVRSILGNPGMHS